MKKFILLGEFSGLHYALKLGLQSLGHDVFLISNGDKKKNLPSDLNLDNYLPFLSQGKLNSIISSLLFNFPDSDHVSIVSPILYGGGRFVREFFSYLTFLRIFDKFSAVSFCAAGSDYFWLQYASLLSYYPYDCSSDPHPLFLKYPAPLLNSFVATKSSYIFGFTPDYFYAYKERPEFSTKTHFLPMVGCPLMSADPLPIYPNKSKIRILFGANKPEFKGAAFIKSALRLLSIELSDIEIIMPSMCSSKQWLEHIKQCDILIDQCRTYSYGVNALYGMAYGKIVLTGWSWGETHFYDQTLPPVISIKPSIDSIYHGLKQAIRIFRSGLHSPNYSGIFYDRYHSPISVASKFLNHLS